MSRSTIIKYKGKTIAVLGRTVDMTTFPLREKNVDRLYDHLSEEKDELIKYLLKDLSAAIAHHPTKKEVSEWLSEVNDLIEYIIDKAEELGVSRTLINMMEEEDIDIEFN